MERMSIFLSTNSLKYLTFLTRELTVQSEPFKVSKLGHQLMDPMMVFLGT